MLFTSKLRESLVKEQFDRRNSTRRKEAKRKISDDEKRRREAEMSGRHSSRRHTLGGGGPLEPKGGGPLEPPPLGRDLVKEKSEKVEKQLKRGISYRVPARKFSVDDTIIAPQKGRSSSVKKKERQNQNKKFDKKVTDSKYEA